MSEEKPDTPYWEQVLIVAVSIALGWRRLPGVVSDAWEPLKELGVALLAIVEALLLPLTFWLAPLYLWLLKRDDAKRKAYRAQLLNRMRCLQTEDDE